jgi:hypothetical protein
LDGSFVLKDPTRAKNRAKEKIVNAILECGDCFDKQALALQSALVDPRIAELSVTAGFKSEESFVLSHFLTQARDLLAVATTTNKKKGRPNNDKQSFAESVGAAMVTTPGREREGIPTSQQQMEFLGINRSLFENSQKKRKSIKLADEEDDDLVEWSQVRKKTLEQSRQCPTRKGTRVDKRPQYGSRVPECERYASIEASTHRRETAC